MGETEEFAEALLDQISVELNEEKEIAELSNKITDDKDFPQQFTNMEDFSRIWGRFWRVSDCEELVILE